MVREIANEVMGTVRKFNGWMRQIAIRIVSVVISMWLILGMVGASVTIPFYVMKWLVRSKRSEVETTVRIPVVRQSQMVEARVQRQSGSMSVQSEIRNVTNLAEAMRSLMAQIIRQ